MIVRAKPLRGSDKGRYSIPCHKDLQPVLITMRRYVDFSRINKTPLNARLGTLASLPTGIIILAINAGKDAGAPSICNLLINCQQNRFKRLRFFRDFARKKRRLRRNKNAPSSFITNNANHCIGVGKTGYPVSPPSEPCVRISRTRLSS